MERIFKILNILKKYTNSNYPFWAEHEVIGFAIDYELISKKDLKELKELGVFISDFYDSLIMYT